MERPAGDRLYESLGTREDVHHFDIPAVGQQVVDLGGRVMLDA